MQAKRYYTIRNMQDDPPEQRAWMRRAAALACVFRERVSEVPAVEAVGAVMLGADYLWARDGAAASFGAIDADGMLALVAGTYFGPPQSFEALAHSARRLEQWLRANPTVLDALPLAFVEETESTLSIPLGPAPVGGSLREQIRAAARRVRARSKKGRSSRVRESLGESV